MTQKTKTSVLQLAPFALGLILTGFITGCGSSDDGPKGGTIDACALLAEMHPEALLGGPVDEGKKSWTGMMPKRRYRCAVIPPVAPG